MGHHAATLLQPIFIYFTIFGQFFFLLYVSDGWCNNNNDDVPFLWWLFFSKDEHPLCILVLQFETWARYVLTRVGH